MTIENREKRFAKFSLFVKLLIICFLIAVTLLRIYGKVSIVIYLVLIAIGGIIFVGYSYTHFKANHKFRRFWQIMLYLLELSVLFFFLK